MLDRDTRAAILKLAARGLARRAIARAVGVSRNTVRAVLRSGHPEVSPLERTEGLDAHVDLVRELHASCQGNLVRVQEELAASDVDIPYSTLTAFCRRHDIGTKPKQRVGRYHFEPGEEMQHDTSPHKVMVGGRLRSLQCASLILCFSRMRFAQIYPRWTRFEARVFLSEALQYLGGAATRCMLDNSTVIIASGTGKNAVPAPAMKALADRFNFEFVAHEVGDANRSARVERPFHHIEHNFYPGRTFADEHDLNAQLRTWCEAANRRVRRELKAAPIELYVAERPFLRSLPVYIPEVYDLHGRLVDVEGYVNLHRNRYSVDAELIHKRVELRETIDRVRIFDGHRLADEHVKQAHGAGKRMTLPKHKGQARRKARPAPTPPHEARLREQSPELDALVDALQRRHGGRAVKAVRRLHRMWTEYSTEAVVGAVADALKYGLLDLARIERMVLRRVAGDFFKLPIEPEDDDG